MSRKPYADDWEVIDPELKDKGAVHALWYSASLDRWWRNGTIYDEGSASHNGLIGAGYRFRNMLETENEGLPL